MDAEDERQQQTTNDAIEEAIAFHESQKEKQISRAKAVLDELTPGLPHKPSECSDSDYLDYFTVTTQPYFCGPIQFSRSLADARRR
jgi:hypothetical protein